MLYRILMHIIEAAAMTLPVNNACMQAPNSKVS